MISSPIFLRSTVGSHTLPHALDTGILTVRTPIGVNSSKYSHCPPLDEARGGPLCNQRGQFCPAFANCPGPPSPSGSRELSELIPLLLCLCPTSKAHPSRLRTIFSESCFLRKYRYISVWFLRTLPIGSPIFFIAEILKTSGANIMRFTENKNVLFVNKNLCEYSDFLGIEN